MVALARVTQIQEEVLADFKDSIIINGDIDHLLGNPGCKRQLRGRDLGVIPRLDRGIIGRGDIDGNRLGTGCGCN